MSANQGTNAGSGTWWHPQMRGRIKVKMRYRIENLGNHNDRDPDEQRTGKPSGVSASRGIPG